MRRLARTIRKLFGTRAPRRPRTRPRVEWLEDRSLLSANASGVLTGLAFVDSNGDGVREAREAVLPGVSVTLSGTTNQGTPVDVTATTDGTGAFSFLNVQPGNYQLGYAPVPGMLGTPGSIAAVNAPAGVTVIASLPVTGGQNITEGVGFRGLAPEFVSLRQFLSTTTAADFPFLAAGSGVAFASGRANSAPVVKAAIADVTGQQSGGTTIDLAGNFDDPDITDTMVQFQTSAGPINVELFDKQAPRTVANFLNYIQSGRFNNTIFHRLESNFVLQGGGFTLTTATDGTSALVPVTADPAVQNEFGTSNTAGTLAMAKTPGDPNSATSQFFFNLTDNTSLDTQNGGFTVFGKVASSADMAVVNQLASATIKDESGGDPNNPFGSVPMNNYTGTSFPSDATAANFDLLQAATIVSRNEALTYSVVANSNPGLVTTSVTNNRLSLSYSASLTGTATITVRATDQFGATVDTSFKVTVNPST
jgi:cyclophilin family peptidyl-prolyl cis-trans isomerase